MCNNGYKKVGENCYEIDPCLRKDRGGCDKNVSVNVIQSFPKPNSLNFVTTAIQIKQMNFSQLCV